MPVRYCVRFEGRREVWLTQRASVRMTVWKGDIRAAGAFPWSSSESSAPWTLSFAEMPLSGSGS